MLHRLLCRTCTVPRDFEVIQGVASSHDRIHEKLIGVKLFERYHVPGYAFKTDAAVKGRERPVGDVVRERLDHDKTTRTELYIRKSRMIQ